MNEQAVKEGSITGEQLLEVWRCTGPPACLAPDIACGQEWPPRRGKGLPALLSYSPSKHTLRPGQWETSDWGPLLAGHLYLQGAPPSPCLNPHLGHGRDWGLMGQGLYKESPASCQLSSG